MMAACVDVGEGAKVILGCRDESAGLEACEEITSETGNSDVHCRLLDLASLASVRRFAQQFLRRELPQLLSLSLSLSLSLCRPVYIFFTSRIFCLSGALV